MNHIKKKSSLLRIKSQECFCLQVKLTLLGSCFHQISHRSKVFFSSFKLLHIENVLRVVFSPSDSSLRLKERLKFPPVIKLLTSQTCLTYQNEFWES